MCSVNAAGADNKYMVSTYSLPEQIASPQGGGGVYTCEGGKSGGAYAQCDGGLCFRSTEETTFPGFDKPVPKGQIVCSCPITDASTGSAQGYQILGPYPCDKSFFKYCKSDVANSKTGSTIYVGAPTGTAAALTALVTGKSLRLSTSAGRNSPARLGGRRAKRGERSKVPGSNDVKMCRREFLLGGATSCLALLTACAGISTAELDKLGSTVVHDGIDFKDLYAYAERSNTAYEDKLVIKSKYPKTVRIKSPDGTQVRYFLERDDSTHTQFIAVRGTHTDKNLAEANFA